MGMPSLLKLLSEKHVCMYVYLSVHLCGNEVKSSQFVSSVDSMSV